MFGLDLGPSELLVASLIVFLTVLWFWMLIDALMNEPSPGTRTFWVIVIFLTWAPGALAYALLRYRPRKRREWRDRPSVP